MLERPPAMNVLWWPRQYVGTATDLQRTALTTDVPTFPDGAERNTSQRTVGVALTGEFDRFVRTAWTRCRSVVRASATVRGRLRAGTGVGI